MRLLRRGAMLLWTSAWLAGPGMDLRAAEADGEDAQTSGPAATDGSLGGGEEIRNTAAQPGQATTAKPAVQHPQDGEAPAAAADDDLLSDKPGPKAADDAPDFSKKPAKPQPAGPVYHSWFLPPRNQTNPRSDVGVPIVSFLLPGFGQWLNGEYTSATVYSGAAIAGYTYAGNIWASDHLAHQNEVMKQRARDHDTDEQNALSVKDIAQRKYTMGGLVAQGAGGISLYHSFRTAVATRRATGQYAFLARDETPMELFAAPLHFAYLERPTTYIPLAIGALFAALQIGHPDKDSVRSPYTGADAFFTSSFSYNAGTHEEAVFRGWLMPVMHEYLANDLWSNVMQSVLFAAAHLNTNATPLPQLLLGFDLGYVTQKNHWELGESVFIHVWWDVMAFYASYQYNWKYAGHDQVRRPAPVLWAPPVEWHF